MTAAAQRRRVTFQQKKFATLKASFRSGLEEKIAGQIEAAGLKPNFEKYKLPYIKPEKKATYTPDFPLDNGIIVETKGLFQTQDRQKMKLIRAQYPDLDIRFVFSNAKAKIAKQSKTTYAKWAEDNGFGWAHRDIPEEWLTEPPEVRRVAAMKAAFTKPRHQKK